MENYIRISENILNNQELNLQEKFLLGILNTYQMTVDGKSTGRYCFEKQVDLANKLNISIRAFQYLIKNLIDKKYIFTIKKRDIAGGKQFKNRKALVMVDEFNKFQETKKEVVKKEVQEIEPKNENQLPEKKEEIIQNETKLVENNLIDNKEKITSINGKYGIINIKGHLINFYNEIVKDDIYWIEENILNNTEEVANKKLELRFDIYNYNKNFLESKF